MHDCHAMSVCSISKEMKNVYVVCFQDDGIKSWWLSGWPGCPSAWHSAQGRTQPIKKVTLWSPSIHLMTKIITIMAIHRPRRALGMIFYASSAVERVEKKKYQEELNKQLHQKGRLWWIFIAHIFCTGKICNLLLMWLFNAIKYSIGEDKVLKLRGWRRKNIRRS